MFALLFLALGAWFFWMVYQGYSAGEIKAQGWGWQVRTYQRDEHPVWYWVTLMSYFVAAVWSGAFGVLMAFRK